VAEMRMGGKGRGMGKKISIVRTAHKKQLKRINLFRRRRGRESEKGERQTGIKFMIHDPDQLLPNTGLIMHWR